MIEIQTKTPMALFGNPRFLGIDFGTASLKAVELELVGDKPVLVNYGVADFSHLEEELKEANYTYDEAVALYLHALLAKMNPKTDKAHIAMPAYTGLIALVDFPSMSDAQMSEAVRFEAHKYVPMALDDVALSWEIVGRRETGEGEGVMEVLLVAALKKEVARYQGYIAQEKLEMSLLEIETFSIVRSLIGTEPGAKLLIDLGSRATNIILADGGEVKLGRNIDTGGKDMTRTLAETMDVTKDRAEDLKKSGKDFLNQPTSAVTFPSLQIIVSEAMRVIESHETKHPESQVSEIILSGGSARLAGLPEYLSKLIGRPVTIGHPWSKIQSTEKQQAIIHETGSSFAVAIGLALGGIENHMKASKETSFLSSINTALHKKL